MLKKSGKVCLTQQLPLETGFIIILLSHAQAQQTTTKFITVPKKVIFLRAINIKKEKKRALTESSAREFLIESQIYGKRV